MRSEKVCDVITPEDIFQCRMCGECCRGFGGTYVTEKEIKEISGYLKIAPERFLEKYCQMSCSQPVLAQREDGFCVFYNEKCAIHPVKPHMCKAWPFIEAVVKDVSNWKIMASSCRGIRTDFPDYVIVRCVQKVINERG